MTIAWPSEPATMDPYAPAGDAPATRDLLALVMHPLWTFGADGAPLPSALADAPVVDAAAPRSITVTFRDDAFWSDGTPVGARDLHATLARARRGAPWIRSGYERIARITTLSQRSARIELDRPHAEWRTLFSPARGLTPAHVPTYGAWRVSSGPFVLRSWRRGLDMTFVRNARAPGGGSLLDRIRVVFVPDAEGARELLRRGEVDALGPYASPEWSRRASEHGRPVVSGAGHAALVLHTRRGVLREAVVRRAIASGFEGDRIVRTLVGTEGEPAAASIGGSPATAEAILQRGAWTGEGIKRRRGRRLAFTIAYAASDELAGAVARALQFQLGVAGMAAEPVALDDDVLWSEWLTGPDMRAAIVTWRSPEARAADPTLELVPLYRSRLTIAARSGVCARGVDTGPLDAAARWFIGAC